jgi:ABC-2 type transport system permease protein
VPGAVLATGLLLCVRALIGVAFGAIIRHTAGGIAAAIGLILLPSILALLPPPWNDRIGRFTLLDAVRQLTALHPQPDMFAPALSLLAWPAAALAAASLLITRPDV